MSGARCDAMWADKAGLFRKMWAAEPFEQRSPTRGACWEVRRDLKETSANKFFRDTFKGAHCNSNWFEGNKGELGQDWKLPHFSGDAPALLGFDETIDSYCGAHRFGSDGKPKNDYAPYHNAYQHAKACVEGNFNILSLYGDRVPYNTCRNLEWQVCAALGQLPGQGGPEKGKIIFSKAPSTLDPRPTSQKPFGECRGWRSPESQKGGCSKGFATDDIYYLEVCLFHQMCENGDELFRLRAGEKWQCELSQKGYNELTSMLQEEPDYSRRPQGAPPKCLNYCNQWTCSNDIDCGGCPACRTHH